jgi:hypothetical protein
VVLAFIRLDDEDALLEKGLERRRDDTSAAFFPTSPIKTTLDLHHGHEECVIYTWYSSNQT